MTEGSEKFAGLQKVITVKVGALAEDIGMECSVEKEAAGLQRSLERRPELAIQIAGDEDQVVAVRVGPPMVEVGLDDIQ